MSRPISRPISGAIRCGSTSPSSTSGSRTRNTTTLFKGVLPPPCEARDDRSATVGAVTGVQSGDACLREAMSRPRRHLPARLPQMHLPDLLRVPRVVEVRFALLSTAMIGTGFPECEPCCLDDLVLRFPEEDPNTGWARSRSSFGCGRSCVISAAPATRSRSSRISAMSCDFSSPDFIRQLAAFQMLRDQFRLKLTGDDNPAGGRNRRGPDLPAVAVGRAGGEALALGAASAARGHRQARRMPARVPAGGARSSSSCWPTISIRCRAWPASIRPRRPTPGTRRPPTRCASPKSWPRSTRRASPSARCCSCSPPTSSRRRRPVPAAG